MHHVMYHKGNVQILLQQQQQQQRHRWAKPLPSHQTEKREKKTNSLLSVSTLRFYLGFEIKILEMS